MAGVAFVGGQDLRRPLLAAALIAAALVVTIATTGTARRAQAPTVPAVALEMAVGIALVLGDGWAFGTGHAFSTALSLGSVWPLAGVMSAGVALGPWTGVVAGVGLGLARMGSAVANGVQNFDRAEGLSLVNSIVFYVLAGAVPGPGGARPYPPRWRPPNPRRGRAAHLRRRPRPVGPRPGA